jgi:hypothetical protein
LTAWPSGTDRPVASNLNLKAGQAARANLVVAKLGWSGRINLYAHQSGVDVVIDVIGYLLDEPSPVRSMATAYNSTCMVDWLGRVWCSGLVTPEMGPDFGPLQDHPRELRRFPSIGDAVDVAVSTFGTICIVRADGTVWCWGPTGLLPPASNHMPWPPSNVPGISNVVDLEISTRQACALDVSGDVWCWGTRFDDVMIDVPTRVQGLGVTTQISVGDWVTCALQQEGTIACWGG